MAKIANFFHTVFVVAVWQTFCVNWVWKTFLKKWIWQTFCVSWVHDTFFIKFVCRKLKFDKWKAWVYLSPAIILLLIFTVWPIINTTKLAFVEHYSTELEAQGVKFSYGFSNFTYVITTPASGFVDALKNTLLLCVLTVPLSTFLALLIAVCLNAIKPLQKFLQTIFFLPYVTNSIAIGMVFFTMFGIVGGSLENAASYGLANNLLKLFGLKPIDWVNTYSGYGSNLFVLTFYIVWNALPFKILVLLGGLQGVNKQYYEAAKIDGTPRWRVFTKITIPLLSPMIAYVVITGFIGGFKEYSSIVGVFGDTMGPEGRPARWQTMVGIIYDNINSSTHKYGYASAMALMLFGIIFVVTMINLYVSKKKTHY